MNTKLIALIATVMRTQIPSVTSFVTAFALAMVFCGCGKNNSAGGAGGNTANANAINPTADNTASPAIDASSLKYGLFIHFGMQTFANPGEKGQVPASRFAPTDLDISSWVRVAKENGMDFAILTAKHETGFCLWESADYKYDVAHSPVRKDLVAEFVAACKDQGIVPGMHYSIPDAYNEGTVKYKDPVGKSYFNVIKKQLAELQTQHPDLQLIALDVAGRLSPVQLSELRQQIKRLNSSSVILGVDGYKGGLDGQTSHATITKNWMWSPGAQLYTAGELYQQYSAVKALGRPFVINVGPDRSGKIPADQLVVLKEFTTLKN